MSNYPNQVLSNVYNGRVIQIDEKNYAPSYMMSQIDNPNKNTNYQNHAVSNIQQKTPLSNLYFSHQNIQNVQHQIRHSVYKMSNGKHIIGPQSETELKIIMRAYYLQYGKFTDDNLKEQIQELNKLVIQYAVPQIMNEIEQYNTYLYDVQHLPMPMERSLNVSSAGTRNLKSVTSTF